MRRAGGGRRYGVRSMRTATAPVCAFASEQKINHESEPFKAVPRKPASASDHSDVIGKRRMKRRQVSSIYPMSKLENRAIGTAKGALMKLPAILLGLLLSSAIVHSSSALARIRDEMGGPPKRYLRMLAAMRAKVTCRTVSQSDLDPPVTLCFPSPA